MTESQPTQQTLSLKYRPRVFSDVVGNEQNAKILQEAARRKQFPQAVLFAGTHGSGKCISKEALVFTNQGLFFGSELLTAVNYNPTTPKFYEADLTIINKNNKFEHATSVYYNGRKATKVLTFDNGMEFEVTPNHPLYCFDPNTKIYKFIKAKDIIPLTKVKTSFGQKLFQYTDTVLSDLDRVKIITQASKQHLLGSVIRDKHKYIYFLSQLNWHTFTINNKSEEFIYLLGKKDFLPKLQISLLNIGIDTQLFTGASANILFTNKKHFFNLLSKIHHFSLIDVLTDYRSFIKDHVPNLAESLFTQQEYTSFILSTQALTKRLSNPSDFFITRIDSIPKGTATFDLVVPETHSFIANGLVNHNTSMGRILGRAICCEHPLEDGNPCNTCESCLAILKGNHPDYIELDAASENSVNDIRQMIKSVNYLPTISKHKVIMMDECFTADTPIYCADHHYHPIKQVIEEDIPVYSINTKTHIPSIEYIQNPIIRESSDIFEITTPISRFKATSTHKLLARSPEGNIDYYPVSQLNKSWCLAKAHHPASSSIFKQPGVFYLLGIIAAYGVFNEEDIYFPQFSLKDKSLPYGYFTANLSAILSSYHLKLDRGYIKFKDLAVVKPFIKGNTVNYKLLEARAKEDIISFFEGYLAFTSPINDSYALFLSTELTEQFALLAHIADIPFSTAFIGKSSFIFIHKQFKDADISIITEQHEGLQFIPISHIDKVPGTHTVYDFEVPLNHNFIAFGMISSNCHMLSPQAANAFLKTLEEPPSFVRFILATTELHKILDTIKSRCLIFNFRDIQVKDIVKRLTYISEQEQINIDKYAIDFIAKHSNGSMRDSVMLLDQARLITTEGSIQTKDIMSIIGIASISDISQLFGLLKDADELSISNWLDNHHFSPLDISSSILNFLEILMLIKQGASPNLFVSASNITSLSILASKVTFNDIALVFKAMKDFIYDSRNLNMVNKASLFRLHLISLHQALKGVVITKATKQVQPQELFDAFDKFKKDLKLKRISKETVLC